MRHGSSFEISAPPKDPVKHGLGVGMASHTG